jgi:hypothetical protein
MISASLVLIATIGATAAQTAIGALSQTRGVTITGEVLVETDPRWFRQHRFTVGERLTVTGEMDDDDFDARRITRADGTVLTIRPDQGPPPWAGRD